MNAIQKTAADLLPEMTAQLVADSIANPMRILPREWEQPTWGFWAKFASLLRSQLDLAASLREWIVEEGLTLPEAQAAFRAVSRPARRAEIQFPGQVVGELAKEVARLVELRRRDERRRNDALAAEESQRRADPDGARAILASIGLGGK